mmetsp:Transcript_2781/g.7465  ORF Transcript_2781/g.7465 Transcript_2781/m.7465 type:complete len:141 (-) Transcript_2781:49-471(-)
MAPAPQGGDGGRALRSEGLLPALGVGAAVYFTVGAFSLSTIGLIGIGAGVGYGAGSWVKDKYREFRCKNAIDKLHPAVKVALQQWEAFLASRIPGRKPTRDEALQLFTEFEQLQPSNAEQVRSFVHARGGDTVGNVAMSA